MRFKSYMAGMLMFASCSDPDPALTRSFYMGFSPWVYDATVEAQHWVYDKVGTEGDVISHHLEEGVPWVEAFANQPYAESFRNELAFRKSKHIAGQKIVVQISPLNVARTGIADYRGTEINMPLPAPWNSFALNSAEVKTAYLNYATYIIDFLQPDYLLIGVEVNLLIRNNPDKWSAYVELNRYVYTELKKSRPSVPLSVSVFCVPYFPQWSSEDILTAQLSGLENLHDSYDILSFSIHPFMSALLAESFPENYLKDMFALTRKPVAISESSYPAQVWSTTTTPTLTFNGTSTKQKDFIKNMLSASQQANAEFVIWFTIRDYDALWNGVLKQSEDALVWRDTGLYSEDGSTREAHAAWLEWFKRGHVNP